MLALTMTIKILRADLRLVVALEQRDSHYYGSSAKLRQGFSAHLPQRQCRKGQRRIILKPTRSCVRLASGTSPAIDPRRRAAIQRAVPRCTARRQAGARVPKARPLSLMREPATAGRVTNIELFFDLVYVFAV